MNVHLRLHLALLCFPSTILLAQQKLSLSAAVTPTFSHTIYKARFLFPDSDGKLVEPIYMNGPRWASGYSVGVSLLYTYAPGWSVSSGIWFHQLTTRQARQLIAGDGITTVRNRVVRVPLLLNCALSTKRLSPYFSFGFLTDIPLPSRVVVARTGQSTQYLRLETSSRPIFHLLFGSGGQYQVSRRFRLMVQPVWTYNLGQLGGASAYDSAFELSVLTQLAYSF